jgi:hypothetical protein
MAKKKKHYVDTKVLEKNWADWLEDENEKSWEALLDDVYKICEGASINFKPRDKEEHLELTHETFAMTINKIKNRKLVFEPGRAPVFNLLTTTIMRQLYSLKNKDSRRRRLYDKYLQRVVNEKFPEVRSYLTRH